MTGGEIMKLKKEGVNTMLAKIEFATYMTYWKIRHRLMKMANEEDGMETLETILIVALAIVILGIILNELKGEQGLIAKMFKRIETEFNGLFNSK